MSQKAEVLQFKIGNDTYCIEINTIEEVIIPSEELKKESLRRQNGETDEEEQETETNEENESEENEHLTNIPHTNENFIGLMQFRDNTLEVVDPVGVFNLKTKDQIKADRKHEKLSNEIRLTFSEIEEYVNDSVNDGNMDSEVAQKLGEKIKNLQEQVLERPSKSEEVRNVSTKSVIVLNKNIGDGENYVGLLVDSIENFKAVYPSDINSSVERDNIVGTIKDDETSKLIVWIDPRETFSKELFKA